MVQSDLSAAETEKENLVKKVQLLEKAIESPNSRTTLQRLLERFDSLLNCTMYNFVVAQCHWRH